MRPSGGAGKTPPMPPRGGGAGKARARGGTPTGGGPTGGMVAGYLGIALFSWVVVETLAGLPAKVPRHHHALEEGWRGEARFPELVEHHLGDEQRRVQSDQVEERERPHRVAAPELHRLVDVFFGRDP